MSQIFIPLPAFQSMENTAKALRDVQLAGAKRVFLSVGDVGRPPFARNEQRAALFQMLKEKVAYFAAAGIEPAAWISTLGFGIPTTAYNRQYAADYTRIRSIGGQILDDALCPLDPAFSDMMCDMVEDVARTGVPMIMLDDELCLSIRPGLGCACDLHMDEYRRRLGEEITREELGERVYSGKPSRYRDV